MKLKQSLHNSNERGARRQLLEELFYDFYRNRTSIYLMNFTRGLFFGFGTVLGGTVIVAIIVWLLSQFAGWFPGIGDVINNIIDTVQSTR